MIKIITKKYIKDFVLDNLDILSKENIEKILSKKNVYFNEAWKKERLIELIKINKFNMMEIYNEFKDECFGVNKFGVKKLLNIDDESFEYMIENEILTGTYSRVEEEKNIMYYSLEQIYKMSIEGVYSLKYKIINEKNRVMKKEKTGEGKRYIKKAKEKRVDELVSMYKVWKEMIENSDEYVILSIESNNIEKIRRFEISIIDFQGVEVYYTNIQRENINKEEIQKVVDFINENLMFKKIVIYDLKIIKTLKEEYGLKDEIECIGLMELYMNYRKSRFTVRLERALNFEGVKMVENDKKSLRKALNILGLIKGVVEEISLRIEKLNDK